MKQMIISIIITLVYGVSFSIEPTATPSFKPIELCNIPIFCPPNTKYPFRFYDGKGNIEMIYSESPSEQFDEFEREFVYPYNSPMPLCLEFIDSGPEIAITDVCANHTCSSDTIYRKVDFASQMKQAMKRINCLCGFDDNFECECKIKVMFTKDERKFKNPENDHSSNNISLYKMRLEDTSPIDNSCTLNCDEVVIYLNYTDKLVNNDNTLPENKRFDYFFVIDDYYYNQNDYIGNNPESVGGFNLLDVLTCQLALIRGVGKELGAGPCFNELGILSGRPSPLKSQNLSDYEKCALLKLNCNFSSSVEYKVTNNNVKVYPNPAKNTLIFEFENDLENNFELIEIYDNAGKKITFDKINISKNSTNKISLNLPNIMTGSYFYQITYNNNTIKGSFIISE